MADPARTAPPASPGVHFPPPFLYVGVFLVGLLLQMVIPVVPLPRVPSRVVAALLLAAGFGLIAWSMGLFTRAGTSPLPMRPAAALVRSGPYRWSRNPMYLGMLLLYAGVALLFDVFWALVLTPLVPALVVWLVIRREERYLEERFGGEYRRYQEQVRRWI
jgi:protein-S-isoprenylcysteine O-methyltransferase Ste14